MSYLLLQKKTFPHLLAILLLGLTACSSNKRELRAALAMLKVDNEQITKASETGKSKSSEAFTLGGIEENLQLSFSESFSSIEKRVARRDSVIEKTLEASDPIKMKAVVSDFGQKVKQDNAEISLLLASLNTETLAEFPAEILFDKNKVRIPLPEKETIIRETFKKSLDSLIGFSNRYANQKRRIQIVLYLYSDAQEHDKTSPIFKEIVEILGNPEPVREEINRAITLLRGSDLAGFLNDELQANAAGSHLKMINVQVESVGFGKGEEYPNTNTTDYKTIDPRRRVVRLYWKVLPQQTTDLITKNP